MKKHGIIALLLTCSVFLSLFGSALAFNWEDFTDVAGHYAEETVHRGFDDGLIQGFDDATIRPDAYISTAQMITILTRLLGATETADASVLGITEDIWYYEAAGKALKLGLIDASAGDLDAPMIRQNALAMMVKAFSLTTAQPDFTKLDSFSDAASVKAANRPALAALVNTGLVQGFAGALNANGNITRAEFLIVLYRVAQNYIPATGLSSLLEGGTMVKGSGSANYITLTGNLWFDCSASSVSLNALTAGTVTLKSHTLAMLTVSSAKLNALVLDCGNVLQNLGSLYGSEINTLRLQSANNFVISDSVIKTIEITGSNQTVTVGGKHDSLIVSGNNNTITLSDKADIGKIVFSGTNNILKTSDSSIIASSLEISGEKNQVSISDLAAESKLKLSGKSNTLSVSGKGSLTAAEVLGYGNWLTIKLPTVGSVSIDGEYNAVHKPDAGETGSLNLSGTGNKYVVYTANKLEYAVINGAENILTVDGSAASVTVEGRRAKLDGAGTIDKLTLNGPGSSVTVKVTSLTDNSRDKDVDRVLSLVTLGYKGNYTLAWAQEHDYEDFEKEIWVDAKGYSSKTEYLIWINLSMQRVNIFKGSKENWVLQKSFIVGSGAPGSGTPVGIYTVTYKQSYGWTTSSYTVKPVVGFKTNSGYAFHSRLYYPNSSRLKDASIGYPVSHGCIRMYDEDLAYIWDNIPVGTTVVVY